MVLASNHGVQILAGAIILASAVFITSGGAVADDEPLPGRLNSAIDQEVASLKLAPRTKELISEKTVRARQAIERGDFTTAQQIFEQVLKVSKIDDWRFYPFDDFIQAISNVTSPSFKAHLDEWAAASNTDALPLLIRAKYYFDLGWLQRGHKSARRSEHLNEFTQSLDLALIDIDKSLKIDARNPYSFYLKLQILAAKGASVKVMDAFKEAIGKYPNYYLLYDTTLYFYQPKWGGSILLMYSFVDQYAGHAPESSPLKLLYVALYRDLLNSASISCQPYWSDADKARRCVKGVMQQIVTPKLQSEISSALQLYNRTDHYEFGVALQHIFAAIQQFDGVEDYSDVLFQQMKSLMPSESAFGSYNVDRAAFAALYYSKNYEEALKKEFEIFDDILKVDFVNEETKMIVISKIYADLAATSDKLHKYEDVVKFASVSGRVGGPNEVGYLTCSAYQHLQLNEDAVRACTQAVEDRPNKIASFYWRGLAYRALNQPDAALADLKIVVASADDLRGSAVLAMSEIYLVRGETQTSLDVLNQHPYLFADSYTSRKTVAQAFYARCNVLAKLGDTMKALADCSSSLRYDNRAEVASKQKELLETTTPAGWISDNRNGCKVWDTRPEPGETIEWSGGCTNGIAQGNGTLQWYARGKPGEHYEGEVGDGRANGRGTLISSAARYDGEWRDGRPEGVGKLVTDKGEVFEGFWHEGCFRNGGQRATFARNDACP